MSAVLSRFSLKYQVGLIGLIGVIGLGVFGIIYFAGARSEAFLQIQADQAQAASDLAGGIDVALLQARRSEKDFLLRKKDDYIAKNEAAVADASGKLDRLTTLLQSDNDKTKAGSVKTGLKAYADQFGLVSSTQKAIGLDENSGLMGDFRKAVHAVEDGLKDKNDPQLTILMLTMRRNEKDFLARVDPKYSDAVKTAGTTFATTLASSTVVEADRASISSKMQDYQRGFATVATQALALSDQIKGLSTTYAKMEPDLLSLFKSVHDYHDVIIAQIDAKRAQTASLLSWAIGLVMLIVASIAWVVARQVSRPIITMTLAMARLAGGDKTIIVEGQTRRDEIGAMAKAVSVFKENAIEVDRLQAQQREAERLAAEEKRHSMNELADGFQKTVGGIVKLVSAAATEMQATAQGMAGTADRANEQTNAVANASSSASANVQMVATAAEELSSSVSEISRQVAQSSQITNKAVTEAQRANETISELSSAAQLIGQVMSLISDIASQTNLLALNATIEAARAGEAGKGFAVVASEVKNLANQTSKATDEIASQISNMQNATEGAVGAIKTIGATISQINDIATTIASAVEEQGAATKEIARNVQQAASGTQDVSDNIQGVSRAVEETGAAASQVLGASEDLARQGATLSVEVDKFLVAVRAA